eukprot:scaffold5067_cov245-Pinguiococcus_pyrenoidosus.AAC.14
MIAWAWYRQGPQATIRKICQLVPCSCRSSLFMEVSLASRTRDIEEGLDIRYASFHGPPVVPRRATAD